MTSPRVDQGDSPSSRGFPTLCGFQRLIPLSLLFITSSLGRVLSRVFAAGQNCQNKQETFLFLWLLLEEAASPIPETLRRFCVGVFLTAHLSIHFWNNFLRVNFLSFLTFHDLLDFLVCSLLFQLWWLSSCCLFLFLLLLSQLLACNFLTSVSWSLGLSPNKTNFSHPTQCCLV